MSKRLLILMSVLVILVLTACQPPEAEPTQDMDEEETGAPTLKACFIYVGPIGDYGWSHAHEQGRLYVESQFDWLETAYAESVAEADVERFLDRFVVEEDCDVVFTTSFGFMDGTAAAAEKYPDKLFFHCSG